MAIIVDMVTDNRSLADHYTGSNYDRRSRSRVRMKTWSIQEGLHFIAGLRPADGRVKNLFLGEPMT